MDPLSRVSGLTFAVLAALAGQSFAADRNFEYSRISMGTKLRVVLVGDDEPRAAAAAAAMFAAFDQIEEALSDWRPTSEVNRFCDGAPHPARVGETLWTALFASRTLAERTDGAFDPTIGPVVALWRQARHSGALPDPGALAAARALVGWRSIALDESTRSASLDHAGMRLDFGAIGKGIAVDVGGALLDSATFPRHLIDFGSTIAAGDPPTGRPGWRIAAPPAGTIDLRRMALSTSGTDEQFVEIAGVRYSHLVDPTTGVGLVNGAAATAIAPSATVSDVLSTALCVVGVDGAAALLERFPGVCGCVTMLDAGEARRFESPQVAALRAADEAPRHVGRDPGAAMPGTASPAPTEPLRILRKRDLPGGKIALDVATINMKAPGRPDVSLVGVTHIGSRDLYAKLQQRLDGHALVLYESVMPPGIEGPHGATGTERTASTRAAMEILADTLERLRVQRKVLPETLEKLPASAAALDSRLAPLLPGLSRDAWGRPLRYERRFDEEGAPVDFALVSLGADGVEGGEGENADIELSRPKRSGVADQGIQADLAAALGLEFQLHALDYAKPNWRYADMTMDQLQGAFAARGADDGGLLDSLAGSSLPAQVAKLMLTLVRLADGFTGGGVREMLKTMLVELFAEADIAALADGALGKGMMEVIVGDRNQVAVDALRRAIDGPAPAEMPRDPAHLPEIRVGPGDGSVAIFYGAAHLPDLVERLRDQLGYDVASVDWITAIEADVAKSGLDERTLGQIRAQVKRAMREAAKSGR